MADTISRDAVVEMLAKRSFTVASLLRFYQRLPDVMAGFDPLSTKTNDVVRNVIIPETADDMCAYAEHESMGGPDGQLPDFMVTHNWSNVFSHLVAAVVAVALEQEADGFWHIIPQLDHPAFMEVLENHAVSEKRCWLCIFCVNQHLSICGVTHDTCDSVTGLPFSACPCKAPKYTSGTLCEMDKFDEMLAYMKANVGEEYYQGVACDKAFDLLGRTWAVAEVAECFRSGIPLRPIVYFPDYRKFKELISKVDVRQCKAFRQEDTDRILSKIDDKDAFNKLVEEALSSSLTSDAFLPDEGDDDEYDCCAGQRDTRRVYGYPMLRFLNQFGLRTVTDQARFEFLVNAVPKDPMHQMGLMYTLGNGLGIERYLGNDGDDMSAALPSWRSFWDSFERKLFPNVTQEGN